MRHWIVILAVFAGLVALVRSFPLAWAGAVLPDGLGTYSGTVWNGQINQVPLLGSVQVEGKLTGARLVSAPGDITFSGDVSPTGVSDLILSMPVALLPTSDARLSDLAGRVSLRIDEARIDDGNCVSATGHASTDVLAANDARFGWTGPELAGPVDCVDGRLRVQLSGEESGQAVSATITTGLDGLYQSDVIVMATDPMAGNVLTLFGFNPAEAGRYTLSEQGRWR